MNASINLRDKGLRILQLRPSLQEAAPTTTLRTSSVQVLTSGTGDKACRPDVSHSKGGRKKSTTALSVGQEAYCVREASL